MKVLEWLFLTRGVPKFLRSDNRPEFVVRAVCRWLETSSCQTLFITPGSPWENGYIESFFAKRRDECLNREVFCNGREAQAIVENWRQEYDNDVSVAGCGLCQTKVPCEYRIPEKIGKRKRE